MTRVGRIASIAMAALLWWGAAGGCGAAKLKQCQNQLAACQAQPQGQLARTGQTACYDTAGTVVACAGTGQDGELQKGLAPKYVDNGDGTVTDLNTGLMWEKKSDDGSIHDQGDTYTWADSYSIFIAVLNGGGGFAGHTDWRLPNFTEALSIVNLGDPTGPACGVPVDAVFNTSCTPGCTVTTCSCTPLATSTFSPFYWSSTSTAAFPQAAWVVSLRCSRRDSWAFRHEKRLTRAVRGGS